MKHDVVDAHLVMTKVEYARVKSVNGLKMEVDWIDSATVAPDGSLKWKGHWDRWTVQPGRGLTMSVDQYGRYQAHDENGNWVAPD